MIHLGKVLTLVSFALVGSVNTTIAAEAQCDGSMCAIPVIQGAKCALSAYTNAADTWSMSASMSSDGSSPFNTQSGSGEDNTPMKWTSGNAVFEAEGEYVYITFTAQNGGESLDIHTGSGFADGTSSAIMNGEDGADEDFNDVIANVTCIN